MSAPSIQVELPVCDMCQRAGKIPAVHGGSILATFCTGPMSDPHPRQRLRTSTFIETTPYEGDPDHVGEREYGCPGCGNAVWKRPGPGRVPKCAACKEAGR